MNIQLFRSLFAVVALAQTALAGAGDLASTRDRLECGDADVSVETSCLALPEIDTQCARQTIRLENRRKGISKKLPHEGQPVAKSFVKAGPVLDALVTSWACLKSTSGKSYILLLYTCSWGEEKPSCAGNTKEWERLFDATGRHLTAGFRRQDRRYDALYRRIGLSEIMRRGADLQTVRR